MQLFHGENGLLNKASTAANENQKATAEEELKQMLMEIQIEILQNGSRKLVVTDCDKLANKEGVEEIEYLTELASTETNIIRVENPAYALVKYKGYIFTIDRNLSIINVEENDLEIKVSNNGKKIIVNIQEFTVKAQKVEVFKDDNLVGTITMSNGIGEYTVTDDGEYIVKVTRNDNRERIKTVIIDTTGPTYENLKIEGFNENAISVEMVAKDNVRIKQDENLL